VTVCSSTGQITNMKTQNIETSSQMAVYVSIRIQNK